MRNIQQQPTTEYLSFSNEESSQEESNLFLEAAKELHDQYYKNNYNLEQVKKIAKMAYELNQELDKESLIKLISQNTAFYAEMVFPKKSVSFDFKGTEPVENDPFELKLETTLFYFVGYLQDYISQNRKLTGDGIIKYVQDAGYLKSNNLITKEVRDSANELADACNKLKQNEQLLKSPNIFAKLFGFLSMVFGKGNRHTVEAKLNKLKDKVDSRKDNKI